MPNIRVDEIKLHYSTRGRGAPLLMLQGLGGSGAMWGDQFLDALAGNFRLLISDNRGTGGTERGTAPYTIARLASDAVAVLDAEGIAAAHVFGISMGGMIAQHLALDAPARVAGLVLGCTTCGGDRAVWPGSGALAEVERLGLMGATALVVTPEFLRRHPDRLARLGMPALARPTPPQTLRDQLAAIAAFDTSARLHQIAAPTLVITGDRDLLIPPQNARVLVRGIRGAAGVIVRDSGHLFFWEAPERAAGAIVEFLRSLAAPTAA